MQPSRHHFPARAARILLLLTLVSAGVLPFVTQPHAITPVPSPSLPALTITNITNPRPVEKPPVSEKPAIEGWVTDKATGEPLSNAKVSLIGGIETHTDSTGHFAFSPAQVGKGATSGNGKQLVDIVASMNGHGEWSLGSAVYYAGDTLRVYPKLGSATEGHERFVAAQSLSQAERPPGQSKEVASQPAVFHIDGVNAPLTPPASIRVYRTESGQVEVVPFRDYVKHTLPNEWIPTWSAASLKAGAMAIKSYAWYWVSRGGKQGALGADVKDNVDDQVYDPNVSYASTDAAVDATFNYVLSRNGALFQTQYCAGAYSGEQSGACPWAGSYMTQWGSAYYSDRGKPWGWILEFYYSGARVSPNPPGGGYDGTPPPTSAPGVTPAVQPTAPPAPPAGVAISVGQGSTRSDLFQEAYSRNGGQQALGAPTGQVHWWLPYLSENNVVMQPFAGANGRGNTWLVLDTLKSNTALAPRAFLLTGDIGAAYANHVPPGPAWVGAPTSDPYRAAELGDATSQGFTKGTLWVKDGTVQFTPWPTQFSGWKAEYFPGHQAVSAQLAPAPELPGQPALILDLPAPDFDWPAVSKSPLTFGVGAKDWSAQFSRDMQVAAGTYDFAVSADNGMRLWIDGLLAINGWTWSGWQTTKYSADLDAGSHTIRIQYFGLGGAARLTFTMTKQGGNPTPQPDKPNGASLRATVRWIGRQASPNDSWVQPLTLLLSAPGNPAIIGKYQAVTDRNGVAFYDGLPAGTFDAHVKGAHSLQSAKANVTLSAGGTADVDMKTQIEGDIDGDNCVTVDDYAQVQAMLGTRKDTPGFNPAADLNNDGVVDMTDVSLLRSGFDMCGDVSADNQFQILSTGASPSLAQTLSPWTNPEGLRKDLSLFLSPSIPSARVGDVISVLVVAETGTQAIDGASFIVKYDPKVLGPVDAAGNSGKAEPGTSLPAVMGNWVDSQGGAIGYSAGMLQGEPPQGRVVIAKLRFRVLSAAGGQTQLNFAPAPSSQMQLTNGGVNLLAGSQGAIIRLQP